MNAVKTIEEQSLCTFTALPIRRLVSRDCLDQNFSLMEKESIEWEVSFSRCVDAPKETQSFLSIQKAKVNSMAKRWGVTERITLRTLKGNQFSSVQSLSCVRLCDPMNLSTPDLPVHHQLPEFTQTHVHRVCDVIQPSHPLSSPSPPAPNPSQHQSLFQWVNSSHEVAKVLEFQL